MNIDDKRKLEHDFLNAIVIVNSIAKSSASFVSKISNSTDGNAINQNQLDRFSCSMGIIQEQAAKLENYFKILLNERRDV